MVGTSTGQNDLGSLATRNNTSHCLTDTTSSQSPCMIRSGAFTRPIFSSLPLAAVHKLCGVAR